MGMAWLVRPGREGPEGLGRGGEAGNDGSLLAPACVHVREVCVYESVSGKEERVDGVDLWKEGKGSAGGRRLMPSG